MNSGDDYIAPPREGKTHRIAVSATPGNAALPTRVRGYGYVRCVAKGADVQLFFADNNTAAIVFDEATNAANMGPTIHAGTFQDYEIKDSDSHVAHVASASGFLEITRAGRERTQG